MIRRDLLKGLLTGVAALVMGRSAKAAPAPNPLDGLGDPVKVMDPGIDVPMRPFRLLRSIRIYFDGIFDRPNQARVAIKMKDGRERGILICSTPDVFLDYPVLPTILLTEDETLLVYTFRDCREPYKLTSKDGRWVSYDAVWREFDGKRTMYHQQSVRV